MHAVFYPAQAAASALCGGASLADAKTGSLALVGDVSAARANAV